MNSIPADSNALFSASTVDGCAAMIPGFDSSRSDARIIMGSDEGALLRLWREKRGEVEPEDLSGNLVIQLGVATEDLNRRWYEGNTGQVVTDIQRQIRHPALR